MEQGHGTGEAEYGTNKGGPQLPEVDMEGGT